MLYRGTYEGGCFCGTRRCAFTDVVDAGYCHCLICRRSSGAPIIAWVNTPRAGFRASGGKPRFVVTSAEFRRACCPDCGTIMWTESIDAQRWDMISVHHGTIDRALDIEPSIHLCHADRLPWLRIDDRLPRVDGNTLAHPGQRNDPRWQE